VLRGTRAGVPQGLRLRSRGPLPLQSIADLGDERFALLFPQRLVHQFIITSPVISFPLYACQASLIKRLIESIGISYKYLILLSIICQISHIHSHIQPCDGSA
jgi:hypothetical protein